MREARRQAQRLLGAFPCKRKPFLRRSLREDALFTCDLPRAADIQTVAAFQRALTFLGWQVMPQGDFLELTPPLSPPRPGPLPPPGRGLPALERLCSLCARHPDEQAEAPLLLAFLKAEETGADALEKYCHTLCRDCAQRLRQHQPLPGSLLPYAQAALARLYEKETLP